jgi:hypothetical protein
MGAYLNKTQKLPITGKPKKLASLGQALYVSLSPFHSRAELDGLQGAVCT